MLLCTYGKTCSVLSLLKVICAETHCHRARKVKENPQIDLHIGNGKILYQIEADFCPILVQLRQILRIILRISVQTPWEDTVTPH